MKRMRALFTLIAATGLMAGSAAAQTFDATAAHRLEMERLRARTEAQAATAAAFRAQTGVASQQLQATTRNDGGVAAAVAADIAVRAEARRQDDLARRAAEDAALELERRLRSVQLREPR